MVTTHVDRNAKTTYPRIAAGGGELFPADADARRTIHHRSRCRTGVHEPPSWVAGRRCDHARSGRWVVRVEVISWALDLAPSLCRSQWDSCNEQGRCWHGRWELLAGRGAVPVV